MTKMEIEFTLEYRDGVTKTGTDNCYSPGGCGLSWDSFGDAMDAVTSGEYGNPEDLALVVTFEELED